MKLGLLLCFLCVTLLSSAQELPKAKSDQDAVQNPRHSEAYSISKFRPDGSAEEDGVDCAYIRAYRVRRESRYSDAIAPAGYKTCVAAKRFEFKSAMQVEPGPAPRE